MPDGGEHALDRVGRPQVVPVLGREVVERQQRVPVLGQAGDRLLVLGPILLGERRDGCLRRRPVRRVPNLELLPVWWTPSLGCFLKLEGADGAATVQPGVQAGGSPAG